MARITLNEKHILKLSMKRSGNTVSSLAEKVGVKEISLANQIRRIEYTLSLSTMYQLLDAIGFEMVVRDKDGQYGGVEYIIKAIEENDAEWIKQAALESAAADIYLKKAVENKNAHSDLKKPKEDEPKPDTVKEEQELPTPRRPEELESKAEEVKLRTMDEEEAARSVEEEAARSVYEDRRQKFLRDLGVDPKELKTDGQN